MIGIKVRPNEEPEKFIKRFMNKVRNSKILEDYRQKMFYEKPSTKKRRKQAQARWRVMTEE